MAALGLMSNKSKWLLALETGFYLAVLISGYLPGPFFIFLSFLVFPLMIFTVLMAFFFAIRRNKYRSIYYAATAVIFLIFYGGRFFQINFGSKSGDGDTLKVLSYNIGGFKQRGTIRDREKKIRDFCEYVSSNEIDVICLQEFSYHTRNIKRDLNNYGYREVMFKKPSNPKIGIREVFFLKKDFTGETIITDSAGNDLAVKIKVFSGNDTLTFVNTHIKSFNVKGRNPLHQASFMEAVKAIGYILGSILDVGEYQINQVEQIINSVQDENNVITCGDFNNLPSGYIYTKMKMVFKNAYEEVGSGMGVTYLGKTLFFARIDNQFYKGKNMRCVELKELDFGFSDHKSLYGEYLY